MKTVKDVDLDRDVKRHPETLSVIEILGKPIYVVGLPDWNLGYVEYDTKEELNDIKLVLYKLEDEEEISGVRVAKITDKRIYFEL